VVTKINCMKTRLINAEGDFGIFALLCIWLLYCCDRNFRLIVLGLRTEFLGMRQIQTMGDCLEVK